MPRLQSIDIYPIKGTRRLAREEAEVERRGLVGDRRWMLVDSAGVFLSQRTRPRMALLRTEPNGTAMTVTAPGMPPLTLSRPQPPAARATVQIWNDAVAALPAAAEAHAWFSRFLEQPCRLVFMDNEARRPGDTPEAEVSFADTSAVLLTTQASLDALNARLDTPVPMNRFRPNLVVAGTQAFEEDHWQRVQVGDVAFRVVKSAGRCVVTTTDQDTGEVGLEPLRTLATFRKRGSLVYFGLLLAPLSRGRVRVGDPVTGAP